MAYVIADPCVSTCDTACVNVCPVDCILGPVSVRELESLPASVRADVVFRVQLYIDPEVCICCGACQPECPVEAIFDEDELPEKYVHAREANAAYHRSNTMGKNSR